jgi:hypothetical protein
MFTYVMKNSLLEIHSVFSFKANRVSLKLLNCLFYELLVQISISKVFELNCRAQIQGKVSILDISWIRNAINCTKSKKIKR